MSKSRYGYVDILTSFHHVLNLKRKPPVLKFIPSPEVKSKMFGKPSEPSHQPNIVWREVVLLQPQISHLSRSQLHIAVIHGPRMTRLSRFQPPCFGAVPYLCLFDGHGFVLWMSTWPFPSNCTDTQRRRWLSETGFQFFCCEGQRPLHTHETSSPIHPTTLFCTVNCNHWTLRRFHISRMSCRHCKKSHGRTATYDCHRQQVWTCASKRAGVPKTNGAAYKFSMVFVKT